MGLFIGIGNYISRGFIRGGGTKPTEYLKLNQGKLDINKLK